MKTGIKIGALVLFVSGMYYLFYYLAVGQNLGVMAPKGHLATEEWMLILIATLLMLFVVLPVIGMSYLFAWRYRAENTKAIYTPEWSHSVLLETICWGIPIVIIIILGTITWTSSHELDPYKELVSTVPPITIQVIALDWKWLFIYPKEGIATVNYLEFPEHTPINFQITADAPMNSFWIPQLGGQIYAMPGMRTLLHLVADEVGNYPGSSANFSGDGFSEMKFIAHSVSRSDYDTWVVNTQHNNRELNSEEYTRLALPSTSTPISYYSHVEPTLYESVIMKYMLPPSSMNSHVKSVSDTHGMNIRESIPTTEVQGKEGMLIERM